MSFTGRTAMVTGSAGALGSVVARRLASGGVNLVLPVRHREQSDAVSQSIGIPQERLLLGEADLADESEVAHLVAEAGKMFRGIDLLVNCAGGYAGGKTIEEVSSEAWDQMLTMNLKTAFVTCRSVLPGMRQRNWGRIVNVAAASALAPGPRRGPYQISKRGVITLTESIAEETRGTGITANAIAPTIILTSANRQSMPDADISRWVPPEDIAELIVFFCSDAARFVTGNVIRM